MKKIFIAISFVLFCLSINAQDRYFDERYIYTQHFINPILINPGVTGIDEDRHILFNYRNKWASFPGAPKTVTFSYNGPIANRLGFGALVMNDSNAGLRTTKGQLSLSYTIDSPTNKVGFGLSTEFIQHKVSGDVLSNSLIDINDEVVLDRLDGNNYFDASFGIYGIYESKITYGIAFPSLISSKLSDSSNGSRDRELGYIFNVGYIYNFEEQDIYAEPSIIFKKLMFVPTAVDINLKLQFLERKLTGGITYAVGADERFGFLLGAKVNSLNFNYSYNVSRHDFQEYNNGSHELSVGITMASNKKSEEMMIQEEMLKN